MTARTSAPARRLASAVLRQAEAPIRLHRRVDSPADGGLREMGRIGHALLLATRHARAVRVARIEHDETGDLVVECGRIRLTILERSCREYRADISAPDSDACANIPMPDGAPSGDVARGLLDGPAGTARADAALLVRTVGLAVFNHGLAADDPSRRALASRDARSLRTWVAATAMRLAHHVPRPDGPFSASVQNVGGRDVVEVHIEVGDETWTAEIPDGAPKPVLTAEVRSTATPARIRISDGLVIVPPEELADPLTAARLLRSPHLDPSAFRRTS